MRLVLVALAVAEALRPAKAPAKRLRPAQLSPTDVVDFSQLALPELDLSSLEAQLQQLTDALPRPPGPLAPYAAAAAAGSAMAASGVALLQRMGEETPMQSQPVDAEGRYSPAAADAYFSQRPAQVIARAAEIAGPALSVGAGVLLDLATGTVEQNQKARAEATTEALVALGPTFIKVGQALSIRSDLLPAAYCDSLTTLQDACPPFDDAEAKRVIARELGAPAGDVFLDIGARPIASASLGQVYVAHVRQDDAELKVAVKVQRPGVAETIALDLHLLRITAGPLRALFNLNTDLVGLVDAWGVRFVDELDYTREAANARQFSESVALTPLAGAVFAPEPLERLTSTKVLTTAWVEGNRLDALVSEDEALRRKRVAALCGVAMNAYLTMMLETGTLHADPHPGNLIVEEATGRLAILDWGLVTELDPGLRVAYIEHIAHLVAKDYASVPDDLVKLGFVPEGYEDAIAGSDAVEVLAQVYTAFAGGGGAAKIDVPAVLGELRALADRQGNLFRLPPYFAYIARAFSVLEGIGLQNDPDYAIVGECLPYVSQRLLSDPSPRVAKALETFVYGAQREDGHRKMDADRLSYLVDGLSSYAAAESNADLEPKTVASDALNVARKAADLLLADGAQPTPLQALAEEEVSKALGALGRASVARLRRSREGALALTLVDPLGLLDPLLQSKLATPDTNDKLVLATLDRVRKKAGGELGETIDALVELDEAERREALGEFTQLLWENRAGGAKAGRRVAAHLLRQAAERLS
mmetsp:Transcript_1590/g.4787  ORF Transcript_1590/g.4787 Transcript_1590/m.4787 type:complete len:762 (-) Transcript_1590:42-2327(-)